MEKSDRPTWPAAMRNSLPRRSFLKTIGAGALATFFASPAWSAFELSADEMDRWKHSLFRPFAPRLYFSDKHTDARMHLGGIGTGNLEIGADGQLTTWQLFNTLRDGQVPMYFAVNAGGVSKMLQTVGGPNWPRIRRIEMTGEYPTAILRFNDDDLPVRLELKAFTPWEPLNVKLSSMPLAVFHFRITNLTSTPQTVSLGAMMTNPVGYAAIGEMHGSSHPALGSNVNESFHKGHAAGILMSAQSGDDPSLDRPVSIFLLKDMFLVPPDPRVNDKNYASVNQQELAIPPLDRPANLKVHAVDENNFSHTSVKEPARSVIWLEEAPTGLTAPFLSEVKHAVESGATLVFSGGTMPLLSAYATVTGGKSFDEAAIQPDIIFEDFENGYGRWTQEGNAFGTEPAHGPFANQQPVSGFAGKSFANSYAHGDEPPGKLTSQTFTIERSFIRFLIAGGHFDTTQARLVINGRVVRAASGQNDERFRSVAWNVAELRGQTAHIEIMDDYRDGWGHIMVDEIVFADGPVDGAVLTLLEELLPVRFSAVQTSTEGDETSRVQLQNVAVHPDAQQSKTKNGLDQFTRSIGNGRVVLIVGQILDPAHTCSARLRQMAYATLCSQVGTNYIVTEGQSAKEPGFGTMALAALKGETTGLTGFTHWDEAWKQFQEHGRFSKLKSHAASPPTAPGETANCALATTITVPAGGTVEVPFLLAWHYPNKYSLAGEWMGCHYATQWPNARAVMDEAITNYGVLHGRTELFRQTFYDSTLPYWLLDAMTANSAIIRHIGVVFQIANGDIFGWEGSNGSCDPTCTHVWGYEQALARLFPGLEREMRRIDYQHQQNADGGINNRTAVPSPSHPTGERPFTDGHAS
ncbi:MAG TPA: GH116 family glycosyl-hydrolase, partial [Verrucomicrobiae bacterium]|nr:GH116 family glycosyl-hydrolase [Verrucomicrobiae bacterium]